jgi:hypothetical protein
MTRCPRCSSGVAAYTLCERCGLMLGFDGFTVLLQNDGSPEFQRARKLAHLKETCTEWKEENGDHFLRVTYTYGEIDELARLCATGAKLGFKKVFVTGLEVPWSAIAANARQFAEYQMLGRPERPAQRMTVSH